MACKKPIFMLIDGVSRELVEEAKCGVYVEPENIQDFKDKILYFLSLTSDELKQMGEAGYNYAKKYFDREALANTYILNLKEATA
jgi:glycosyltransferase involved in cell wall biosynthesis